MSRVLAEIIITIIIIIIIIIIFIIMVPHSWIIKSLQLVGAADNVINILEKSMLSWRVQLNAGDQVL